MITVDFRSHVPIYTQIVERIRQLLATEHLKPGDQLPTVRQLAADLRVNFNTVARAYRLLDEAGVISTQQGRGTYVIGSLTPGNAVELRRATVEGLVASFLSDAAKLGLAPDEVAAEVRQAIDHWRKEGAPPEDVE